MIGKIISLDFYILLGFHLTMLTISTKKLYKLLCASCPLEMHGAYSWIKWIHEKLCVKNGETVGQYVERC